MLHPIRVAVFACAKVKYPSGAFNQELKVENRKYSLKKKMHQMPQKVLMHFLLISNCINGDYTTLGHKYFFALQTVFTKRERWLTAFICNINSYPMRGYRGGGEDKFCSRGLRCEYTVQGGKYLQTCDMPKNSASVCSFP